MLSKYTPQYFYFERNQRYTKITRFEPLFLPLGAFILEKKKRLNYLHVTRTTPLSNIPEEGAEQPKGQTKNLSLDTSKQSF